MTAQSKPKFTLIGGGRAGASLAYYLRRRGYPVLSLVERNPQRIQFLQENLNWAFLHERLNLDAIAESDVVLLCVHDGQVAETGKMLAEKYHPWRGKIVAHLSGVQPSAVLAPLKKRGALVASVHPVYSFALDPRENHHLNQIWFNLEGDEPALELFEKIFEHSTNPSIRVSAAEKKAIHLACVFYANFYVALAKASEDILRHTPIQGEAVYRMLNPLLHSSIEQVTRQGPAAALTGPIRRGDLSTVEAHLQQLREQFPHLEQLYRELSRALLSFSELPGGLRHQLEKILE